MGATIARDSVPATLAGVLLSASRPTSDRLGLVIEAGRHSGTESATLLTFPVQGLRYHYTETSAAAGLRYLVSPDPQGMVPFVQLQLGINRRHSSGAVTSATTSLVVQPELGIDFGISKAFALRAQQDGGIHDGCPLPQRNPRRALRRDPLRQVAKKNGAGDSISACPASERHSVIPSFTNSLID
jgi:hypothetical protein